MAGLVNENTIIVVTGPTATGKSSLALELCRKFNGELISADSMQIYKELEVGTAALTAAQAGEIALHMSGFLPPSQFFSVAEYTKMAHEKIEEILGRKKLPIVCGGTGLYIQSLVQGIKFADYNDGGKTRAELEEEWNKTSPERMLSKLAEYDYKIAKKLSAADKKRIIRALELSILSGKTAEERQQDSLPETPPYNSLLIGLNYSERDELYMSINLRVEQMLKKGLLEEARFVFDNKESFKTAAQAIGYKEFFGYFENVCSLEESVEKLKQATRNYAKRQLTWFNKMPVTWFMVDSDFKQNCNNLIENFLREQNAF